MNPSFWAYSAQILLMLLVAGGLGVWLGYLIWHRWRRMHDQLAEERDALLTQNDVLRGDLSLIRGRLAECERMHAAAVSVPPDDLKRIEGIGPKIEKLCNSIGIWTWQQLAYTSPERLQRMLDEAGPEFRIAVPKTWPQQAAMAARGAWEELKAYQDVLRGGRESS